MENDIIQGVSQKTMSLISGISTSLISRYISANQYTPIELDNDQKRNLKYSIDTVRKVIGNNIKSRDIIKKRHSFYNFKGGTGKTSICYQVSSHIALLGYKVLVIDADPQGHLSTSCGFYSDKNYFTLYDGVIGDRAIEDIIQSVYPGYDCIPSNLSLTRLEAELNMLPRREERLKLLLEKIETKYDFVFIDTNPTISHLNRNVVVYCDVINVVTETQPYSLNGLKLLVEDLEKFYDHMRLPKRLLNIIPNKYEDRMANSAEGMTILRNYYSKFIREDFAIRKSEDINTASKFGSPLAFFAKKNSNALEDIVELVHYMIELSEGKEYE